MKQAEKKNLDDIHLREIYIIVVWYNYVNPKVLSQLHFLIRISEEINFVAKEE